MVGRRIANEVLYAYEGLTEADRVEDTVLIHKTLTVDVPLRRVTPAERDAAVKAIREFADEVGDGVITFNEKAKMYVHAGVVARSKAQEIVDTLPNEIHVIRLGDVAFATNPYELFLDYGNQMRARSHASQTFLVQLACGYYGYLPTEKAEQGSHYSAYVSSGVTGHEGGDLLVRKTVQTINELLKD